MRQHVFTAVFHTTSFSIVFTASRKFGHTLSFFKISFLFFLNQLILILFYVFINSVQIIQWLDDMNLNERFIFKE